MKRIINTAIAVVVGFISVLSMVPVKNVSAGIDESIAPLFSGYVEDENKATLISQETLIDMSLYNGIEQLDNDVGEIIATTSYSLTNVQEGAVFCVPYLGTLESLNKLEISVNGQVMQAERLYGETPSYFAGTGTGYRSVLESIESVQPTKLKEGMGKLYAFAAMGGELEFSFQKNSTQTVIYDWAGWISHSADDYSFKVNNSELEGYPYRLFVSEGELLELQSNVEYTVSDISYQTFVDYYVNEIVAEMGEQYRPVIYSQFNRSFDGQVKDVYDVLFNVSLYTFALLKITLSIGTVSLVVKSKVKPLVNGLYKPYIYLVRTVSPYPQPCAYSLQIVPSENLPYVIENNIGLSDDMRFASNQQITDGYYVCCSEKQTEYVAGKKSLDDNKRRKWFGIGIGAVVLAIAIDVGILMIKGKKNK